MTSEMGENQTSTTQMTVIFHEAVSDSLIWNAGFD